MGKIITSKRVKITSKGRYQHKFGVVYGPTRHWYRERVEYMKELLKKYPDIEIMEDIGNGDTIRLNLQNLELDNKRKPVSMMEDDEDSATVIPSVAEENIASGAVQESTIVDEQRGEPAEENDAEAMATEPVNDQDNVSLDGERIAEKEVATTNVQQNTNNGGNNKKKNKKNNHGNNNGSNLAVTPQEP